MATNSTTSTLQVPNVVTESTLSSTHTLIWINVATQAPLKLSPTNYIFWKAQFDALLIGYDLFGYFDGSLLCPQAMLKEND